MFFSLDGIDGAGKSTQLDLLVAWLREKSHDVVTCRDPGSTKLGEALRMIVLQSDEDFPVGMRSEMLLYMAARAQLVDEVIRPALDAGKTVVCDRFLLANVVYQGYAGGLEVEQLWDVGRVATGGLLPDLTFVLDMEPIQAGKRMTGTPDRMESRGLEYLTRVREGFLTEASHHAGRIVVVDADRPIQQVQADIRNAAARHL